jgi:outer membrane protein assembly factor BamB
MTMIWTILVVVTVGAAEQGPPTFYGVVSDGCDSRLHLLQVDGTTTTVGQCDQPVGDLGALIWIEGRLLARNDWAVFEVDPANGTMELVLILAPHQQIAVNDMTYAADGKVYIASSDGIYRVDPETWEPELRYVLPGTSSVEYVPAGYQGHDGVFFSVHEEFGNGNFRFLALPEGVVYDIGWGGCTSLDFDPTIGSLWCYWANAGRAGLAIKNPETGESVPVARLDVPFDDVTFGPAVALAPPPCTQQDSDADGDIDLEDFAAFMRCFQQPLPAAPSASGAATQTASAPSR